MKYINFFILFLFSFSALYTAGETYPENNTSFATSEQNKAGSISSKNDVKNPFVGSYSPKNIFEKIDEQINSTNFKKL